MDPTFADELRSALSDSGRNQSWLGAEAARIEGLASPIAQPQISKYLAGEATPEPRRVFAIEQALDLAAGSLSRLLGYLPVDAVPAVTVADAAEQDPWLTRDQRDDLVAVWETMRARTRARRELRSTPGDR